MVTKVSNQTNYLVTELAQNWLNLPKRFTNLHVSYSRSPHKKATLIQKTKRLLGISHGLLNKLVHGLVLITWDLS